MPITLKKLAEALGLDHSTVAYALSGKGTVKEATRQRVRDMASRLGYVPNGLARRMRAKHTGVLGLVVPDVVWAYNELVQQIFRGCVARKYEVQIALSEFDARLEDRAVRSLLESRVEGMIVKSRWPRWADVPEGHALRQTAGQGVAVVAYGYAIEGSPFGAFLLPVRRQAVMLAEHLLGLGHRRFAWLLPLPPPLHGPHTDRLEGTRSALRGWGAGDDDLTVLTLAPDPGPAERGPAERLGASSPLAPGGSPETPDGKGDALRPAEGRYGNYISESLPRTGVGRGRLLMRRALALTPRPTAVMCMNDVTATGAIYEAQAQGLRVPQDVAVAASSRTAAAELAPMSLTTADVPAPDAARATLDLLTRRIDRPGEAPDTATIDPVLIVGESTFMG